MSEQQSDISVHAGFPNPAADVSLRTLDLNQLLVEHSVSTYYFRIRGQDWQELGIFDGDIALVDRALDAAPNDHVIWWQEGREGFSISVRSAMPAGASSWGVVTATIHQFRRIGQARQQKGTA